jgi:hypothetical protein
VDQDQDLVMDPDPAILVINLRDANKKIIFFISFSACWYFLKVRLQHFSKIKVKKKDPDPDPYLLLEVPDPDPGGPKTHGSGGSGFGSATLVTSLALAVRRSNHSARSRPEGTKI